MPYRLRRIRSKDPKTGKYIVLLTNQFEWSAKTIAQIYKERWQIELFFKMLKQQLQVKSFVGTSRNALLSQLWVALIAYLLLCYLKFRSRFGWSLYTICSILPTNLFYFQEEISGIGLIHRFRHIVYRHQRRYSLSLVFANLDSNDWQYT